LGCKKEELPELSQTGANIIACKVNDKAWIADPGTSFNRKEFSLLYNYMITFFNQNLILFFLQNALRIKRTLE